MQMASDPAGRVRGLVVVDISPRAIPPVHLFVLRACRSSIWRPRGGATSTRRWPTCQPQAATRDFLLKNVVRGPDGCFAWRVPLQALIDNYRVVSDAPPLVAPYEGPALFVAGETSPFRLRQDEELIRGWFPAARFITVPGAGHLVHTDQPAASSRRSAPLDALQGGSRACS